ncbi:hypothetical protein FRB98_002239 [Tulasnella sp. 332]|nr:hypothetical protein FRB98_002239 [Tulasnella sp. 332]
MGNSICNMIASGKASRFREIMANRPFLSWLLLTKMWRVGAARRLVEDLESWEGQQLLSIAMDDALSFVPVLRWFEDIWPCPEDRRNVAKAMNDLEHICGLLGRKMP